MRRSKYCKPCSLVARTQGGILGLKRRWGKRAPERCMNYKTCGRKASSKRAKYCKRCAVNAKIKGGLMGAEQNLRSLPQPRCSNYKICGKMASSKRSKFCKQCFLAHARRSGSKSSGNTTTSKVKRANSRRGAIRRSAKRALVIKKEWLKKILKGKKRGNYGVLGRTYEALYILQKVRQEDY